MFSVVIMVFQVFLWWGEDVSTRPALEFWNFLELRAGVATHVRVLLKVAQRTPLQAGQLSQTAVAICQNDEPSPIFPKVARRGPMPTKEAAASAILRRMVVQGCVGAFLVGVHRDDTRLVPFHFLNQNLRLCQFRRTVSTR